MISAHIIELSKDDILDLLTEEIAENPEKYKMPENFCGKTVNFQISAFYDCLGSFTKFSLVISEKEAK